MLSSSFSLNQASRVDMADFGDGGFRFKDSDLGKWIQLSPNESSSGMTFVKFGWGPIFEFCLVPQPNGLDFLIQRKGTSEYVYIDKKDDEKLKCGLVSPERAEKFQFTYF